jgi:prolyl-tRNA synthetase
MINQWANVVRWEMRTRMFLRTAEFLWQEGHTAHATAQEALDETMQMLRIYADFAENWMAMPVIQGEKTEGERFPGADHTYCIEAMMQDRKALQSGTSHFLGQNFARASDITFQDEGGQLQHAWTTSWGVSTRLVGGLIMTHSDDDGLVCPPRIAPLHVVILPVTHRAEDPEAVLAYCERVASELRARTYAGAAVRVQVDKRDLRGGEKTWQWVKRGVPLRLEVGPRDMQGDSVFMARRDQSPRDKRGVPREELLASVDAVLQEMQDGLLARALQFREDNTVVLDSKEEFYAFFAEGTPGGFVHAHFCGDVALEEQIKTDLSVTVRCIPLEGCEPGTCPFTGKPSPKRVVWSRSY